MQEYVMELKRLTEELYTGEEHVAGNMNEAREAERIRGIIESYLNADTTLVPTPMISWRLKAVEVWPKPNFVTVAPYVESSDVEAPTHHIDGDPSDYRAWKSFPEGRIAVTIPPGNPDDLKYVALHAWESGAKGVIVGSRVPRKIVSTGSWGYSYVAGAPTPIPIVVVDVESAKKISWEGKARIHVEARTVPTTGYTVRSRIHGDKLVAVGAHYDRWYCGFQDDILGIAQSILAAKLLSEAGYGVDLLVFTAEEHGAPGYAGWYWAWGSRWYVNQLKHAELTDEYTAYLNFDVAGNEPVIVSGSPQYTKQTIQRLKGYGVNVRERGVECPECDSLNFAMAGIPTISIHSLWNERIREFYHTPSDTPEQADLRVATATVLAMVESIKNGPNWNHLVEKLEEVLGDGPVLARNILYILVAEAEKRGWEPVYRWMAQRFLKPVLIGDYRYDYGQDFEAHYFPEIYAAKRVEQNHPYAVIIPGEEKLLYQPRPNSNFMEQVFYTLLDLWARFRDELKWLKK